jgi:hypothetical protein
MVTKSLPGDLSVIGPDLTARRGKTPRALEAALAVNPGRDRGIRRAPLHVLSAALGPILSRRPRSVIARHVKPGR